MTTEAGWYPDPEDPSQLRYWDGSSWTEHRHPVAGATVPDAENQSAEAQPPDEQQSDPADRSDVEEATADGSDEDPDASDMTVPRPVWEPAPPAPAAPSESERKSKKKPVLVVLGLVVIAALIGGGLFWFLGDDDDASYTWDGVEIADPDGTIEAADAIFAADVADRAGATVDDSRCYFAQSADEDAETPSDVGDEVLCGPVLFVDDNPDDGVFVGFPLTAEENDDGDIELTVGDEASSPRPGPIGDHEELSRPDGAQPPDDDGGIEAPAPAAANAGLVLVDDDLLDDVDLDAGSAIAVGRTMSVELTGLATPDRIGTHEDARRAADGEEFIAFEMVIEPGDPFLGTVSEQLDRFDESDATIEVDVDGETTTLTVDVEFDDGEFQPVRALVSVPANADSVDLVLDDSGVEQQISLLTGAVGDDNLAVLARQNRHVEVDETVTIPGVVTFEDGQSFPEDFSITVLEVGLLYYVTDDPDREPSSPSNAFLVVQHFVTTTQITEDDGIALGPSHVRLYADDEEYDAVNLASSEGQLLIAFEVPADFTTGTITFHGDAPAGDIELLLPEPGQFDVEIPAG